MSNSSHHSVAQEYQVRSEESLPAQDNWLTIKQFSTQYPWPSRLCEVMSLKLIYWAFRRLF